MTNTANKPYRIGICTKITIYTALWLVLAFTFCTVIAYKTNITSLNLTNSELFSSSYTPFITYTLMIVVVFIAACVAIHFTIRQLLAKPLKRLVDSFQGISSSSFNGDDLPLYEDNEIGAMAMAIAFNHVLKRACDRSNKMAENMK